MAFGFKSFTFASSSLSELTHHNKDTSDVIRLCEE
jgi:hypothetical protein